MCISVLNRICLCDMDQCQTTHELSILVVEQCLTVLGDLLNCL